MTQEQVNVGQKAHIRAFSADGPRGNGAVDDEARNDLDNLMLLCHECHQKIDKEKDGGRYPTELLRAWKVAHETRVELVTGIESDKRSTILVYGADIGSHSSRLLFDSAARALFPERYPASGMPIELSMINSSWNDAEPEFWKIEARNLRRQFQRKVADGLGDGTIEHLSVFGLAPQPLLVLLGSLLTDIQPADVYQLRREPQGWGWSDTHDGMGYIVKKPETESGAAALVLSLSATIARDRITSVLRRDVSIWELTIEKPNNDFLRSRDQLREFRQHIRSLLDQIKAVHGQTVPLHVFPAMPVAIAVELGRCHMPKADMRLHVYDQKPGAGFVERLHVPRLDFG